MKKMMVYGTTVLALAAAPVFAQSGSTAGQSGSTPGQAGGTPTTRSGTAGGSMMQASGADHMFVMEAAQGGMAEVALGKLASEKASNDRVKQFGQRMVTDHSKANDELKSLAQTKSIMIPADLDAKHKATEERLSKMSGAAFDRAYIQEMVADHKKDVADFKKEAQGGKDSEVKAWAAKTLPTLEDHYKMVQDISSSLRSGSVGTSGTSMPGTGSTGRGGTGTGSGGGTAMPGSGAGAGNPATPGGTPETPGSAGSNPTGSNPTGTNNPR